jgi:pimeloyl-ACP methyl ester carboxylesterase
VLEGAGHWIQRERTEQVNALLIDFLRSLERPSLS